MPDDILVRLRLAGEQFTRDLRSSFGEVAPEAERAGTGAGLGFVKGFVGAWGAAQLGSLIGNTIREALDYGAELDASSKRIGVNVEALQEWRHAALEFGVSASDLDDLLGDLTQRIGEADGGSRKAQQAFVGLNVGFRDATGGARDTEAVMTDVITRLHEIEDPAERARLGTALLGEEYRKLEPLAYAGADGIAASREELQQLQAVLSEDEIRNLQETNARFEQMKTVLSARIAGVVGENADAIMHLAEEASNLAAKALQAADAWLTFRRVMNERDELRAALSADLSPSARAREERKINDRLGLRETVTGSYLGGLFKTKQVVIKPDGNATQPDLLTDRSRKDLARLFAPYVPDASPAVAPRITGGPGGRQGASRRTSTAEREAARSAEEAIRNEERLRETIARTLQVQEDSARLEQVRAEQGDVAAAAEEARLSFLRQTPLAAHDTVEELAAALGITKQLTDKDRERLQLLIDQGDAAEKGAASTASKAEQERKDREAEQLAKREEEAAQRAAERAADIWRREHERAVRDVADIYEDLFTNGVDSVWDHFKAEGKRALAEIAAQYTISLISGQPFSFGQAANSAFQRSPISSIFFGSGVFGSPAANDNGAAGAAASGHWSVPGTGGPMALPGAAGAASGAGGALGGLGGLGSIAPQVGLYFAAAQASNMLGKGVSDLLGMEYSNTAGSLFGAVGGIIGGLFKKAKYGTAQISGLGDLSVNSHGSGRAQGASSMGGAVQDEISQIADMLGAEVGSFLVSIGTYKDHFRVSTKGQTGKLKGQTSNEATNERVQGLYDFDSEEEAIAFALKDAIGDGAIKGISAASQRILQSGQDLEAAIEKASLIESVPKLLAQRLDPLGSALDEIYKKHQKIAEAMREGAASEEQIADARQLWELEKADAIESIGKASETLKDYLLSLQAGSNSPLSLRKQEAEAEAALAPYVDQIESAKAARAKVDQLKASGASASEIEAAEKAARLAAGKIDQSGFTDASQLLLGLSRQIDASGGGFFEDFNRVRALTQQAIGLVDGATPDATTGDPYASLTASNTGEAVHLLTEIRDMLRNPPVNDNTNSGIVNNRPFFDELRNFGTA